MDTDKKAQIQAHAQAIAALLYEETDPEQVKTLAGIEEVVRKHLLEHVSPESGIFLWPQVVAQRVAANGVSIALLDD
ncbi:MAG: hypothetical protein RLZZ339_426 [Cyanobacteriota bacterium]|jgi:hypothetical protein|uniref:hypothetical protein n=1 Tax=Microcystis wesenbergii TaxID=44823 RepID=UPI0035E3E86B